MLPKVSTTVTRTVSPPHYTEENEALSQTINRLLTEGNVLVFYRHDDFTALSDSDSDSINFDTTRVSFLDFNNSDPAAGKTKELTGPALNRIIDQGSLPHREGLIAPKARISTLLPIALGVSALVLPPSEK